METIRFGAMGANKDEYRSLRLKDELDVLDVFAKFTVFAVRKLEGRRSNNYRNYAEQVIYYVQGHYEGIYGGRMGLGTG